METKLPKIFEEALGKDYWDSAVECQLLAWAHAAISNLRADNSLADAIQSSDVINFIDPTVFEDFDDVNLPDEQIQEFWDRVGDWDALSERVTKSDLRDLAAWAIARSSEGTIECDADEPQLVEIKRFEPAKRLEPSKEVHLLDKTDKDPMTKDELLNSMDDEIPF